MAAVMEFVVHDFSISEACERAGISRSQFYRWREPYGRYLKGDSDALKPKSRRPKHLAKRTPDGVRSQIVELAQSGKYGSANAIAEAMRGSGSSIHTATVIAVLEENGLYGWVSTWDREGRGTKKRRGLLSLSGSQRLVSNDSSE